MKLLEQFKSLKSVEIGALILFILFIIFPFKLPLMVTNVFDSPLGLLLLFVIAIYLFFYTNPILGVIFIFVAYELIRRSSKTTVGNVGNYTDRDNTTQQIKDLELEKLNPVQPETLEEEVIHKMVPARNEFIKGDSSNDFKPNMVSNIEASLYM
jgi:hypothetical protein